MMIGERDQGKATLAEDCEDDKIYQFSQSYQQQGMDMLTVRDYQSAESFGHFNDLSENEEMQEFKIGNSDSEQMNEQRQIPPPVSPSSSLIHREGLTEEFVKCNQLLAKCRILQKHIMTKSTEYIYSYKIGFASDYEQEDIEVAPPCGQAGKATKLELASEDQLKYCEAIQDEMQAIGDSSLYSKGDGKMFFSPFDFRYKHIDINKQTLASMLKCESNDQVITLDHKTLFIKLRQQVQSLAKLVGDQFKNRESNDHQCRICGSQFANGRQLGGHMSRKHPGRSIEYIVKKELQRTKRVQRQRRNYFKVRE